MGQHEITHVQIAAAPANLEAVVDAHDADAAMRREWRTVLAMECVVRQGVAEYGFVYATTDGLVGTASSGEDHGHFVRFDIGGQRLPAPQVSGNGRRNGNVLEGAENGNRPTRKRAVQGGRMEGRSRPQDGAAGEGLLPGIP
jgi:hypothetical protein